MSASEMFWTRIDGFIMGAGFTLIAMNKGIAGISLIVLSFAATLMAARAHNADAGRNRWRNTK